MVQLRVAALEPQLAATEQRTVLKRAGTTADELVWVVWEVQELVQRVGAVLARAVAARSPSHEVE
ncbi:hypothetical protein SZN_29632 [Streptomyces zinciresistens K42]|uniref:Uncharacterized protein n=1 Tax=Streptomyces zinciresistens K42 TaxID=700597 RepID=G2GK83_9ACTN|nr:hypothetical protein SZN_29632 [Streptomyces zinciresistens K42]